MNKKYLFVAIIIIVFLFLLSKILEDDDVIRYKIDNFEVQEKLEDGKSHITVQLNNKFYYYLLDSTKKRNVKNIELYEDAMDSCLFITFNNDFRMNDMICYRDGMNYYFSTLTNPSSTVKIAYENLVNSGKIKPTVDDKSKLEKLDLFTVYSNNLSKDFIFSLTSYKGLYILEKDKIKEIKLFDKDVYDQKLKLFLNHYYIIANYNMQYDFNSFYIVDLKTEKVDKFNFKYSISFNSDIIYIEDGIFYLNDNDNKKQYRIDIIKKTIQLLDDKPPERLTKYIDGFEVISEDKYGYYLAKNNILYRTNSKMLTDILYLFDISGKSNIKLNNDYICWLEDNHIVCYYENGIKTILSSDEFSFNKTLDYYILNK